MFFFLSHYEVETDQRLCERYLIRQSELFQLRFKITHWLTKTIYTLLLDVSFLKIEIRVNSSRVVVVVFMCIN